MKILIIGAGAYGLALSNVLSDKNEVTVYSPINEEIKSLLEKTHPIYKNKISETINYTTDIDIIKENKIIFLATPTNVIKETLEKIKNKINKKSIIIIASKGLCENKFIYDIVKKYLKNNTYVLSGPSFANDMIRKEKLTLTIAGKINKLPNIFNEEYIKIEKTKDIIGTEICGILKNIFAIASGIIDGLGASQSTKAAFLTVIINEITKEIINKKGNINTILLSCGIGDIILTCTSPTSRNYTLGNLIGKKEDINEYLKHNTVEGLEAIKIIKKYNIIDNQLINIIYNVINKQENPELILEYIIKY